MGNQRGKGHDQQQFLGSELRGLLGVRSASCNAVGVEWDLHTPGGVYHWLCVCLANPPGLQVAMSRAHPVVAPGGVSMYNAVTCLGSGICSALCGTQSSEAWPEWVAT